MPRPRRTFQDNPAFCALRVEAADRLVHLIRTVRADMQPRNFVERHLVDELAISKWRLYRVMFMERAVYDNAPEPLPGLSSDRDDTVYRTAMAHAPGDTAIVLAALARLEDRYRQQFCAALRLLLSLRRGNPPPTPDSSRKAAPAATCHCTPVKSSRKEQKPCEPSPITQPAI